MYLDQAKTYVFAGSESTTLVKTAWISVQASYSGTWVVCEEALKCPL